MILILIGKSASGKTTLQKKFLTNGFHSLINFTTRLKRNDNELDEYVFLNSKQFGTKLINGDFVEYTVYNGNGYAMSNNIDNNKDYVLVLTEDGRKQLVKYCDDNGIDCKCIYIKITEELAKERMILRGDNKIDIEKRLLNDENISKEYRGGLTLQGSEDTDTLYNIIKKEYDLY